MFGLRRRGWDLPHDTGFVVSVLIEGLSYGSRNALPYFRHTQMGREAMEGLRFLASLPVAGTGQREGGGFSCITKRIISHPVTVQNWLAFRDSPIMPLRGSPRMGSLTPQLGPPPTTMSMYEPATNATPPPPRPRPPSSVCLSADFEDASCGAKDAWIMGTLSSKSCRRVWARARAGGGEGTFEW